MADRIACVTNGKLVIPKRASAGAEERLEEARARRGLRGRRAFCAFGEAARSPSCRPRLRKAIAGRAGVPLRAVGS
jgi:CelD/BcsL family acetyltransferase involved in cellulose biosynthesis